jgi:glycosyltransferase involved in cell wall biosynthesis
MSADAARPIRLAYVVSHPIQYQANLLRRIAADPEIDLTVFFCSDFSASGYQDKGFGVSVAWDVPLLDGYRSVVLPRWRETTHPGPTRPISRGFFRHLRRGVDGQPFDVLWVHGYSTINSIHAMLAAKALGIPVLLRAESWLADRVRSGPKLLGKQLFFTGLRSLVNAVLPIGTRNAEYWARYLGEDFPAFLMPYAVDNDYFASRAAAATSHRSALQQELGLDPARPVILFASKLQKRKHCDHLLEAYLQLRKSSRLNPYLLVVGDGEMRASLEQRARESGCEGILFAGFRNQSELPRFFDLSSVFVLPSRHEAWGLITNEAMAAALPVIVSDDVGCAADLVHNGANGFVFPVGNIAALRDALEATLQPGSPEEMGERSRQILAHWSYREDIEALRAALHHVTRLQGPSLQAAHAAS